jgi:hypothetical protein
MNFGAPSAAPDSARRVKTLPNQLHDMQSIGYAVIHLECGIESSSEAESSFTRQDRNLIARPHSIVDNRRCLLVEDIEVGFKVQCCPAIVRVVLSICWISSSPEMARGSF